jgi:hypothetical protein
MFATKKDFAILARQISLKSRETTENTNPFVVDVYQIRLWKLIHTPDKADVEAIAQTFQVGFERNIFSQLFIYNFYSVIHKNYFIPLSLYTINVYLRLAGEFIEYSLCKIKRFISLVKPFTIQYANEKLLQFLLFTVN